MVVKKESGRKPQGTPTGSLDPHPKDPTGEVNHLLEAFEAKEAQGTTTYSPGLQESCQLFDPGWVG